MKVTHVGDPKAPIVRIVCPWTINGERPARANHQAEPVLIEGEADPKEGKPK